MAGWLCVMALGFPACGWAEARQESVISELIGGGMVRFFADEAARRDALPSYALEKPRPGLGPAPADFPVRVKFSTDGAGRRVARIDCPPGTDFYGTGEVPGQLRRNGRFTILWNHDAYGYRDNSPSLYQSHPWVLAVRRDGSALGVLADTTYRVRIDTGPSSDPESIVFTAEGPAFPVIVIDKPTPQEVLVGLAELTGRMPLPPKWAIGFHQCRYSYFPEARVREIARNFRERRIPADVIWFDIDYMDGFRVFTFDRGHFPDPRRLNEDLRAMGFHNVWMINPGIKARDDEPSPNDPTPEEAAREEEQLRAARRAERDRFRALRDSGTAIDAWVKTADGRVYQGQVWPGWCVFPDFTDPSVRSWWASLYRDFMAQGITGVWNDMNEPAVFNVASKTMPEDNRHKGDPALPRNDGTPQGPDAASGDHARYHNVYGMQMVKATREGIRSANPDRRPFVLSRANYLGGQRYAATWTGDNTADWYHLESSVPMVLNVGLSGQPFIGPDIGGFAGNGPPGREAELYSRWIGFGALLPFSRGHTGKDTIDKEPWAFGPEVEETARAALERRYRLLPYLYTLFREASVTGLPVARPTFFADLKDPALRHEDDSFLLGSDLLVVAQMTPDRSRTPVMPAVRTGERWQTVDFEGDSRFKDLPRLYLRPGAIVPAGPVLQYVDEKPLDPLTLLVNLDAHGEAKGTLYEDAGDGYAHEQGEFLLTTYRASLDGDLVRVRVEATEGKMSRPARKMHVRLFVAGREYRGEGTDGRELIIAIR